MNAIYGPTSGCHNTPFFPPYPGPSSSSSTSTSISSLDYYTDSTPHGQDQNHNIQGELFLLGLPVKNLTL